MNENNKFDVVGTNIAEKATMIWNVIFEIFFQNSVNCKVRG